MTRAHRLLACLLALTMAPAALAETAGPAQPVPVIRQLVVQLDTAPAALAARLAAELPSGTGPERAEDGAYSLTLSGRSLPEPLLRFLAESLGEGHGLTLHRLRTVSLRLAPRTNGTELRIMLVAPATASGLDAADAFHVRVVGAPMARGAEILVDGATGGAAGDFVLSVPGGPALVATGYAAALAAADRAVRSQPLEDGHLVLGEGPGGVTAVFVQPNPDAAGRSLVVIRALEGK